ncbi:MAG: autotransporter domain-containing protein, partial [Desulfosudaceae bacterium]
ARTGAITLRPEMSLEWGHEYLDQEADLTARFDYAGARSFTVTGAESGRNSLMVGGGMEAQLNDSIMAYLKYNGDYRHDFDSQAVTGGVQFAF